MDNDDLPSIQNIIGGNAIWLVMALVLILIFLTQTIRLEKMTGEQIGVLLNKINGKTTTIHNAGVQIYNGLTHKFFLFDKRIQTLAMTADSTTGQRREKDDIKIKTIDGSDVYIDITVQFKIDPQKIDTVIKTSGAGDAYKVKWIRDYVRTLIRDHLGGLTTEEIYQSEMRDKKIKLAEAKSKERLAVFGIIIDKIAAPNPPRFYKEYEDIINRKKIADQEKDEEQSKAQEAKQRQHTLTIEETNKKNVAVEQFSGKMQQKIITAKAQGEKIRKAADAYYDKRTINAAAYLYKMVKNAEGILAVKKAEAEGIQKLKKALEGEGGRNMVKMEYAKKLKDITISGQPFTIEGHTARFEHLSSGGASLQALKEGK